MPTNVSIPDLYILFSTYKTHPTPFHIAASLPDSGANRSLWHPRALADKGIVVNELRNEVVTVADAGAMRCTGFILVRVRHGDDPDGNNEIIINALVSPSLKFSIALKGLKDPVLDDVIWKIASRHCFRF